MKATPPREATDSEPTTNSKELLKPRLRSCCQAVVLGSALIALLAAPSTQAGQRPIEDFLSAQGTYWDPGWGDPPLPEWTWFYGWTSPDVPYVFVMDYAGIASRWLEAELGVPVGTTFNGSVQERALPDGTTEVTVVLQTRNALTWVHATSGDPTLVDQVFGYVPSEIADGSPAAFGNCTLQVKFIIPGPPGSPLPDLQSPHYQLLFIAFVGQANGPLREAFGVPEGTRGFVQTRQTGLLATYGKANVHSRVALDAFPAEKIIVKRVGK